MAEKKVKITFEVDGVSKTVNSVEDLNKALGETKKATKEASDEGTALGMLKGKFAGIIGPLKGVVTGMKTLKGAIISTGIGALIVALGSLVAYFTSTEEGSKKLAIVTETLGILWGKLTETAAKLGKKLIDVFNNPKQAIKDFGQLVKDNIVERFNSLLEVLGYVGSALKKFFSGDFKGALKDVKAAGTEMVDVFTGVDNSLDKIKETSKRVFNEIKNAVNEATAAATRLVETMRALRNEQQRLIVENANLNKELEIQQKIAEDTTLSYEERKAALERVGEAQVKLAENLAKQARLEESLINQQIAQESNYEKREELETQLAEATAGRIEAETALETRRQDASKITRELELEELDRKRSIQDMINQMDLENMTNMFEQAAQELALQEQQALQELDLLRATEDEKQAIRDGFQVKRKRLADEEAKYNKDLAKAELGAKLGIASDAFGAIAELAGENSKLGKIAAASSATINTYQAATNALANTPLPPPFPQIAAGVAIASGLIQVKKILSTPVPGGGGGGGSLPSISAPTIPQFDPNAALDANVQGQNLNNTVGITPTIKTYVIASDVTNQQEADKKIDELASL